MHKIVRAQEATVRHINDDKAVFNLITKDITPNMSLATTKAIDFYEQETTAYDRIYYVLEGEIELQFGNDDAQVVAAGDACFIAKGTAYQMSGTFHTVVVNQPAFGS